MHFDNVRLSPLPRGSLVCLYVFLSVCPSVFSETINSRVTMSHICLIYVVG